MDPLPSKTCSKCKESLPISKFWKDPSKKDGLSSQCAACKYASKRASPVERKTRAIRAKQEAVAKKDYVTSLKESTACADCGRMGPYYCMDFDHIGPDKNFDVSNGVNSTRVTLAQLKAEVALCEVVCAYCHRVRTHKQGYRRNT